MNKVILLFIFVLTTCKQHSCLINYPHFPDNNKAPFIYITEQKENCNYVISASFWLGEERIESGGELSLRDNAFFLKLDSLGGSALKFFDFSTAIRGEYDIPLILPSGQSHVIEVTVDDIIQCDDNSIVHVFRLKEEFLFEESRSDLVFFVAKTNGIVGS